MSQGSTPIALGLLGVGGIVLLSGVQNRTLGEVFQGHLDAKPTGTTPASPSSVLPAGTQPITATGVTVIDGKPVANWIVPIIKWARQNGWGGKVISGYRSYAEQVVLYARYKAGGPLAAAPGQSNHQGTTYPKGAVDVTDPAGLANVLKRYPGKPNLIEGIAIGDIPHFSATGH